MIQERKRCGISHIEAVDVMTGRRRLFTVYHEAGRVVEIHYGDGCAVPRKSEQFTETEDAFHIDRRLRAYPKTSWESTLRVT